MGPIRPVFTRKRAYRGPRGAFNGFYLCVFSRGYFRGVFLRFREGGLPGSGRCPFFCPMAGIHDLQGARGGLPAFNPNRTYVFSESPPQSHPLPLCERPPKRMPEIPKPKKNNPYPTIRTFIGHLRVSKVLPPHGFYSVVFPGFLVLFFDFSGHGGGGWI